MALPEAARLTRLSIHALRHYDDVGLLIPADTDPQTGSLGMPRRRRRSLRVEAGNLVPDKPASRAISRPLGIPTKRSS
ncbi:MerR family DNA-binding transcriptional regulator [Actinocrispum wychmicini]|uniref:MerR family DNA-binding transcriptional regulator n=1 Tax=Actinocrispum wychmicini TaxID=1213861 RepID=UPI003C7A071F